MKTEVFDLIQCPKCQKSFEENAMDICCSNCGEKFTKITQGYQFNDLRVDINPSEVKLRGDNAGTAWRRANWKFYKEVADTVKEKDVVIDIGAGRADLKQLFESKGRYVASDIFPYPEVNLAGDLGTQDFVRDNVADYLLLSNVIEHLENPRQFLSQVKRILKEDGQIIVAVPFIIKLHQVPVDYGRYTHFFYQKLFLDLGFKLDKIQVVHTPWFFLRVVFNTLLTWESRIIFSKTLLRIAIKITKLARIFKGTEEPIVLEYRNFQDIPDKGMYSFPAGYHLVFSKDL